MSSETFFEKLKKGMGVEGPISVTNEEKPKREAKKKPKPVRKKKKPKKLQIKTTPIEEKIEKKSIPSPPKEQPTKDETIEATEKEVKKEKKKDWFESEGQLTVDVYQTKDELVIRSAIAGVRAEDLDISIENDILIIKGRREKPFNEEGSHFVQECYWGPFSREIILPVEVDPSRIEAIMKEGVLIIRIPKIERERKRKIRIKA